MTDLWTIALPILVVDVVNPTLLAAMVFALTMTRPYLNSLAILSGHTFGYLLAGLLIVYGFAEAIAPLVAPFLEAFQHPVPADFVIGFLLGILLVTVAWRWKVSPPVTSERQPIRSESSEAKQAVSSFALGAMLNFMAIPFALPYFAFINELYKLDTDQKLPALLIYNVLYAAPFLLAPAALAIYGRAILPVLKRTNRFVERYSGYILPLVLGLLGLALIADAVLFFTTGTGLV